MANKRRMEDQVAFVTGASSGIGRATAIELAREGANVVLAGRNVTALQQVAGEIERLGRLALVAPLDVTQRDQVACAVQTALARWGHVDILIASAGQYIRARVASLTVEDLERAMAVSFYGALYGVLAVLPSMRAQRRGHIVLVNTIDAKRLIPSDAPYISSKAALAGLGDVLRQELRGGGVHVTSVFPGRVDTPMIAHLRVPWISAKLSQAEVARATACSIYRQEPEPIHPWLREVAVAFVPGPDTAGMAGLVGAVLGQFRRFGHCVQSRPDETTDVILTTARFGEALGWRDAPLFSARRKFGLKRTPTIYSLVKIHLREFRQWLARFEAILAKEPPDPEDYAFPGLSPEAYHILFEQGRRGGPILALERLIQAQSKSIHALLVLADERPRAAYHFDLVGAYPRSQAEELGAFYEDIVLRIVTTLSTHEVTRHEVVGEPISRAAWSSLDAPKAMAVAARELDLRNFFTEMVVIAKLAQVPAVNDAVASQYSEGCFSTWEPKLDALIHTVTGSARPTDKGQIGDDDLAVIVGVRPDGMGALTRRVEGKRNDPHSSESVEMMLMDSRLPRITLDGSGGISATVPVVRSKLHGHRGIAAFDPRQVEHAPLDPAYYHYLVSCATAAQAAGIQGAFARARALQDPADPRQLVFTVLPGHGAVIVEKWVSGKRPFQTIWEAMETHGLQVASRIPQGPMEFMPGDEGRMALQVEEGP